jgi:uncharacterized protein YceK
VVSFIHTLIVTYDFWGGGGGGYTMIMDVPFSFLLTALNLPISSRLGFVVIDTLLWGFFVGLSVFLFSNDSK